MIYKFLFNAAGDNFIPDNILNLIKGEYSIASKNTPNDKNFEGTENVYSYGAITFWHPKKFSTEENIREYEKWFIEFIENNHKLFQDNGADNFDIYMEIYYEGEQCNFEIFDKNLLKRLSPFDISLPISIYLLKEIEYLKWEQEIKSDWDSGDILEPSLQD